jgi:hypothetical protein
MDSSGLHTQRLDHLGIVAGICSQIGLIEQIDQQVGPNKRKVSVGQAVQAMVLNGLGFVSRPLYLSPEFFENKPVSLLVDEGIESASLNRAARIRLRSPVSNDDEPVWAKGLPEIIDGHEQLQ